MICKMVKPVISTCQVFFFPGWVEQIIPSCGEFVNCMYVSDIQSLQQELQHVISSKTITSTLLLWLNTFK